MKDNGTPRVGRDGKPMEPGIEWQFEITDGPQAGQIVGRITSAVPTTKNACGTLLAGLVGRLVQPDEEVDPDQYRGRTYQIVIAHSKESPEKTYVTQIHGAGGAAPAPAAASPAPAAPKGPPPKAPAPTPPVPRKFWVQLGEGDPVEMTSLEIDDHLQGSKTKPQDLACMTHDQSSGWKTAADFGFTGEIPF
jgi:hypothetical protein